MAERASLLPEKHAWESTAPRRRHRDDHALRRDVWTILRFRASIPHRSSLLRASYAVEACVLVLILLNVVLAMRESAVVSSADTESYVHTTWYDSFLYVSTTIFSVEYLLRLWSCIEDQRFCTPFLGRLKWMLRPMSIIDLVVLVPFYLEIILDHGVTNTFRGVVTLRGLRLLRIMSFLRLERSYNALNNLRELFTQKREELLVVSYLTAVVVVTASTTIFFLENAVQPDVFSSIGVCMWWSIETITSLGYGDIVPITGGGRFFSSILALWGIILFTIPGAILSSGYVEIMLQKHDSTRQDRIEEELRSFSRELEAISSSGFKHGDLHSNDGAPTSPPVETTPCITEKQFLILQQQVELLTSLQHQVQLQLRAQKAQLDSIQHLLEEDAARPSRRPEKPPFSAIARHKLILGLKIEQLRRMVSAAAAARVNLRDVLRVPAVDSYLRNFAGESHRLQEVLEITLSYGVACVARNFPLKGMTVEELQTVTQYDQTKAQDFYVRNGAKPRHPEVTVDPQPLYVKAPHSWRDGESKPDMTGAKAETSPPTKISAEPEVFFLPSDAHKDKLDEIDFYTRVLGKKFVDVAWATYSSRGSAYLDADQLANRMTRVDQRKRPDLIPQTEYPVCSFVQFLDAYVKMSVGKVVSFSQDVKEPSVLDADDDSTEAVVSAPQKRPSAMSNSRAMANDNVTIRTPTPRARTPPAPRTPREGNRHIARSSSLQDVQSKIKPELQAHKEKLLRVKKTHTQLMKESLARARLAEYASRQGDNGATKSPLPVRKMPLDQITPGAAALEIVDDFIRSPLMDKFSADPQNTPVPPSRSARSDPLLEELYGTAAHDGSFLGCKAPKPTERKTSRTKPPRDYSGWLGDFGPQHTKTVRPAWATDATTGGPGADADSEDDERVSETNRRASARRNRFEWKFDTLDKATVDRPTANTLPKRSSRNSGSLDNDAGDEDSFSNDWSVARSDSSDPVFRWLKTAVE